MDHNGISTTTGGGIVAVPGAAGSANVQITNTKLVGNSVGLNLFSSGPMLVAVQGGMVATDDGDGVRAVATAVLNLLITGTSVVNNFGTGVLASGAAATVRIGGATISGNATGVSFAGATMQSFKITRSLAITPTGRRSRPSPAVAAQLCSSPGLPFSRLASGVAREATDQIRDGQ
jgi:hypothetical protein